MEQYLGSISTGTTKTEDLLGAFLPVLKDLAPNQWDAVLSDHTGPLRGPSAYTHEDDYQADASELLDEVVRRLDNLAPEGYYFGALEGDGADFGFHKSPDSEEGGDE